MLILNMLLRITKFTQEKLADYLGVSRASVNSWLSDDSSMTYSSKKNVADKFQFPVSYFDIDLNQDLNLYKVVFSTLYEGWKRTGNDNASNDKITEILNEVESDLKTGIVYNIPDNEIIEGLVSGYNPFTGELFEKNHILNDPKVKQALVNLKNSRKASYNVTKADLDSGQLELFEVLRRWRLDKCREEGIFHAYLVFSDRELINIILANINKKEDLLSVKGIGNVKYAKYGDELFELLNSASKILHEDSFYNFSQSATISG